MRRRGGPRNAIACAVLVVGVAIALVLAPVAAAAPSTPSSFSITPNHGPAPGTTITYSGACGVKATPPGAGVAFTTVTYSPANPFALPGGGLARVTRTDARGRFSGVFPLAAGINPGLYFVTAFCCLQADGCIAGHPFRLRYLPPRLFCVSSALEPCPGPFGALVASMASQLFFSYLVVGEIGAEFEPRTVPEPVVTTPPLTCVSNPAYPSNDPNHPYICR